MTKTGFSHLKWMPGLSLPVRTTGTGLVVMIKNAFSSGDSGKHRPGLFLSREILSITKSSIAETSEPGNGARFK